MLVRLLCTTLVVAGSACAIASPAEAAEVSVQTSFDICDPSAGCDEGGSSYLSFAADEGERNQPSIQVDPSGLITITEAPGVPLRVGDAGDERSCRSIDASTVRCRAEGEDLYGEIGLGDGDDELSVDGMSAQVTGGLGDDLLRSLDGELVVTGEPGADRMVGVGRGTLNVSYRSREGPVRLTVDGVADDGSPGERDNISGNVRLIAGGGGDDVISGGGRPALLYGEAGDDAISGGLGADVLDGGRGADRMSGGAGSDSVDYQEARSGVRVSFGDGANDGGLGEGDLLAADIENAIGSPYDDRLIGDGGPNSLAGGNGSDIINGGGGNDALSAGYDYSSKRDRVTGGAGRDLVTVVDRFDRVALKDQQRDVVECNESTPSSSYDSTDRFRSCAPRLWMDRNSFHVASGDAVFTVGCLRRARRACRGVAIVIAPSGRRTRVRFGRIPSGQARRLRIGAKVAPNGRKATVLLRSRRFRPKSVTVSRYRVALACLPKRRGRGCRP